MATELPSKEAAIQHMHLERESDQFPTLVLKDDQGNLADLTGWTFRCQGRRSFTTAEALFTLESGEGEADIQVPEPLEGRIVIPFRVALLREIPADVTTLVYDLVATSGGSQKRILRGNIRLSPSATQPATP
jgi:hypothetical protein